MSKRANVSTIDAGKFKCTTLKLAFCVRAAVKKFTKLNSSEKDKNEKSEN
jgi:hypothetical protein